MRLQTKTGGTVLSMEFDDTYAKPSEIVEALDAGWSPAPKNPPIMPLGEKAAMVAHCVAVVDPWLADTSSQWSRILPLSVRTR